MSNTEYRLTYAPSRKLRAIQAFAPYCRPESGSRSLTQKRVRICPPVSEVAYSLHSLSKRYVLFNDKLPLIRLISLKDEWRVALVPRSA